MSHFHSPQATCAHGSVDGDGTSRPVLLAAWTSTPKQGRSAPSSTEPRSRSAAAGSTAGRGGDRREGSGDHEVLASRQPGLDERVIDLHAPPIEIDSDPLRVSSPIHLAQHVSPAAGEVIAVPLAGKAALLQAATVAVGPGGDGELHRGVQNVAVLEDGRHGVGQPLRQVPRR